MSETEDNRFQPSGGGSDEHLEDEDLPTLLVVDDDPDILRVVKFYLTKQKYLVHSARSGKEALEIMHQEANIELVLSDVMMPEMNGLDLLSTIRKDERYSEVPVILISAEGETSRKVTGLNLGADDFITKPFNFDELMARVKNHVRLRRLQKEVQIVNRQILQVNNTLQYQNDRLLEDLEAARALQVALLPDQLPSNDSMAMGSHYLTADRLGGDFFDVVVLDGGNKIGILIADVCGHGVAAAFITAMTKISFQTVCYSSLDPAKVLETMNQELSATLRSGYVTVFYGIYDLRDHSFQYASGGHPPLLVHRRETGEVLELHSQATFLGFFNPVDFENDTVTLQKGDRVMFYTDGLYESQFEDKEFGQERFIRFLQTHETQPIQDLIDNLMETLEDFMQGHPFEDDVSIIGFDVL